MIIAAAAAAILLRITAMVRIMTVMFYDELVFSKIKEKKTKGTRFQQNQYLAHFVI